MSKNDTDFGHDLWFHWKLRGRFSIKQWVHVVKLAFKYRKQIGMPPVEFIFPNL